MLRPERIRALNNSVDELTYYFPRSDNNSVVRFDAGSDGVVLSCYAGPSYEGPALGVRKFSHRK